MASTTVLSDDFEPTVTTDVETVPFGYRGKVYEIDLGPDNRKQMDEFFNDYIQAGRPAKSAARGRTAGARATTSTNGDAAAIREWAAANNMTAPGGGPLPKRGRIPAEIREAYEKAQASA